ncbi:hypothetical protein [Capnocytophaga sp.]|uniref:hypothetical protein n=1 Tax=Capnocytophaga sp. TaxID=44737 RepID=UPI0026DCD7A7|nr:hypothetical protein [Capnocytophaga sp.]MDO5104359.1 hypothetical protein [Capnocytophaga sp.]
MAEKYPQTLANNYFGGIIENDQLRFDYKIRDGICRNRNATFLMKKRNGID